MIKDWHKNSSLIHWYLSLIWELFFIWRQPVFLAGGRLSPFLIWIKPINAAISSFLSNKKSHESKQNTSVLFCLRGFFNWINIFDPLFQNRMNSECGVMNIFLMYLIKIELIQQAKMFVNKNLWLPTSSYRKKKGDVYEFMLL